MPYVLRPFSELLPADQSSVIAAAVAQRMAHTGPTDALLAAALVTIENRLTREITHAIERVLDGVEIEHGSRNDSPILEPTEWDAEVDQALSVELGDVARALPPGEWFATAIGVSIDGAVTAGEVGAELARLVVKHTVAGNPAGVAYQLQQLGFDQNAINAVEVGAVTGGPMLRDSLYKDTPISTAFPALTNAAPPPLPGSAAAAKPTRTEEAEAFKAWASAVDVDLGTVAKGLDVSTGSLRNYMTGRSEPRKALTLTQAQRMQMDCLNRIASLQRAAEVFGAVTG